MANIDDLKVEIWLEMQKTLFVENTAVFLASTDAASVLSNDGKKVHKPILSKARTGTYTPYVDITFAQQQSGQQTLSVDTFEYGAEQIDWTDKRQTMKYNPVEFSAQSMQRSLNNRIEQYFLSKITSSKNTIDGATFGGATGTFLSFTGPTIFDVFEASDSKLGSVDAPFDNRVAVIGPHAVSAIRKLKSQRETPLGDTVLQNGVISTWNGWIIVQNNNLPWSGTLTVATQPTDGDYFYVAGVKYTYKTTLSTGPTVPGEVLIGGSASAARTNALNAVTGGGTPGTDYTDLAVEDIFILREKRHVRGLISSNNINFTGFGDIVVSSSFTSANNFWTGQCQDAYFGLRGAIDLVVQIDPNDIRIIEKEKGFADLVKSLVGLGTAMFDDGARVSIDAKIDASLWK
jgi:hypothetical protein